MAKGKGPRRAKSGKTGRKSSAARHSGKQPRRRSRAPRGRAARAKPANSSKRQGSRTRRAASAAPAKRARLDRDRRTLIDVVPTPPSSLNLPRQGSAARTGRAELQENLQKHGAISPALTGGDVDADWEEAYFSGDEAPGGDNPTPDQEIVDDIGKALGVTYQDAEELKSSDKVVERDKHRWELDPASSEVYKERK
jgi:hypothetical protein